MPCPMYAAPRLLLFDPYVGGHHADHVRWIAEAWKARAVEGALVAAVAPHLIEQHPDLNALAFEEERSGFRLASLPAEADTGGPLGLLGAAAQNARLYRAAVRQHRPQRTLAMYFDHLQVALALHLPLPSVPLSGILFRPALHYAMLEERQPKFADRLWQWRKGLLLARALRHRSLEAVFSLDPVAVPALRALTPSRVRVVALPDPADLGSVTRSAGSVRATYGVEPGRVLLVLFGALDERKGTFALLAALRKLPPPVAARASVLLAGRPLGDAGPRLRREVAALSLSTPAQILLHDRFVPDHEVQNLLAAADVVLAPYLRHVGSSGVLMRAAAAGTPVLSQAYGLMGWQVRTYALGRTVDTEAPDVLARALADAIAAPHAGFNRARAATFAAAHTVDAYVDALFYTLLGPLSPSLASAP